MVSLLLTYFIPFSSDFIVDFEQVKYLLESSFFVNYCYPKSKDEEKLDLTSLNRS